MDIEFKQKKIIITFEQNCEIVDLLQIIYFYKFNTNRGIIKLLLKTKKYDTIWVNDITGYLKSPIIFLWVRLMSELNVDSNLEQTNIYNSDLNETATLEITTLTEIKIKPQLTNKNEFITIIFNEWLKYTQQ